jgi:uncharacterized membrane protein
MRGYWQTTRFGWMIIAAMFAVAIAEWPLAPARIPTHWDGSGSIDRFGGKFQGLLLVPLSAALAWGLVATVALFRQGKFDAPVRRALISLGYAILLIFVGVFGYLVLWINGVVLNVNYFLLPGTLAMCVALANLALRAAQKSGRSALPG